MKLSRFKATGGFALVLIVFSGLMAGCPVAPPIVPPPPINGNGNDGAVGGVGTFEAFLFADRTQVIRGDVDEGRVTVTVETSLCATFDWTVCVLRDDGSCSEAEAETLLDITEPSPTAPPSTESVIGATVDGDPGPNGKTVQVTLVTTVVEDPPEGCPTPDSERITGTESETLQATFEVVRPAGPLAVTLSSDTGSVTPETPIGLSARITGGRPFPEQASPRCGLGETDVPYCITWSVEGTLREVCPGFIDENCNGVQDDGEADCEPGTLVDLPESQRDCLIDPFGQPLESIGGETIALNTYNTPLARGQLLIRIEVTDRSGATATASVPVSVQAEQPLSLAAAAGRACLPPLDETTDITAIVSGGTEPYDVCFEIDAPNLGLGGGSFEQGVTCSDVAPAEFPNRNCTCNEPLANGLLEVARSLFSGSPASAGSVNIRVFVQDAVGRKDTDVVTLDISVFCGDITVNADDPERTDSNSSSRCIGASGSVPLSVDVVSPGPVTHEWTTDVGTFDDPTSATPIWSPDGAAPGTLATITVEVEDTLVGRTDTSSTTLLVVEDAVADVGAAGGAGEGGADPFNRCENGSIDLLGAPGGLEYSWSCGGRDLDGVGSTTLTFQNPNVLLTEEGDWTCTLTVTDPLAADGGRACSVQDTISFTVNTRPDVTVTTSPDVCANSSNNAASVPDAGAGSSYDWSVINGTLESGQGTTDIVYSVGPFPGVVDLEVEVIDGDTECAATGMASVNLIDNHVAQPSTSGAVCEFDAADNRIPVSLFGGVGNPPANPADLEFSWSCTDGFVSSEQDPPPREFPLGDTTCTLLITNTVTTCFDEADTVVTVNANPDASITAAAGICAASTGNSASVADAGPGATYAWSSNCTIESGQNTPSIEYTADGVGSCAIDVTVTNGDGCVDSALVTIPIQPLPDATITAPVQICADSTGNVASVPDAGAGANYNWSLTGCTITSGQDTPTIEYTAGAAGVCGIELIVTDSNGCSATDTANVAVLSNPPAMAMNNGPVCLGDPVTLSTIPAIPATFSWECTDGTVANGQNAVVVLSPAGPFPAEVDCTVTVTNPFTLCSSEDTTTVTVNDVVAEASAPEFVCDGELITLTGTSVPPGADCEWICDEGSSSFDCEFTFLPNPPVNPEGRVNCTLTATDPGTACTDSALLDFQVFDSPDATIAADLFVCADSSGNVASVADAGPGATYVWSSNCTITAGDGTPAIEYTADDSPVCSLDVTVTDQFGCSSTAATVDVPVQEPDATITAVPDPICEGNAGTGSVVDAGAGATYVWTVTNGTLDNGQGTSSIDYTADIGVAFVELDVVVTDADGCVAVDTLAVTVEAVPVATADVSAPLVCEGEVITLTGGPEIPGADYLWECDDDVLFTSDQRVVAFTPDVSTRVVFPTSINCNFTVTTAPGCEDTASVDFAVDQAPDATITANAEVCEGSTNNVASVPDAGVGATYTWAVSGPCTRTDAGGDATPSIEYSADAPGTCTIDVSVDSGLTCVGQDSVDVIVNPLPDVTITTPASACVDDTGLVASVPDAGAFALYDWTLSAECTLDSGQGTPAIEYSAGPAAGTCTIDVTVTTPAGCTDTGTADVSILSIPVGFNANVCPQGAGDCDACYDVDQNLSFEALPNDPTLNFEWDCRVIESGGIAVDIPIEGFPRFQRSFIRDLSTILDAPENASLPAVIECTVTASLVALPACTDVVVLDFELQDGDCVP